MNLLHWLVAFVFTQCIEVPVYRHALRGRTGVAFGASALTHPFVWFVFPAWWSPLYLAAITRWPALVIASPTARFVVYTLIIEAVVVVVEATYLRAFGLKNALRWSLVANTASVVLGLVVRAFVGWP